MEWEIGQLVIVPCCMAKRTVCRGAVGANVGRIAQMFDLCSALRQVGDIGAGRQMAYNTMNICNQISKISAKSMKKNRKRIANNPFLHNSYSFGTGKTSPPTLADRDECEAMSVGDVIVPTPVDSESNNVTNVKNRKVLDYDLMLDFLYCARPDMVPGSGKKDAPLRQWSKEIGISHPTLCKLLQRKPIKLETFLIICSYLEMSTDIFIKDKP